MLQQTQVDRVLPKYHEWLDEVPVASTRWPRARRSDVDRDLVAARLQHPAAGGCRRSRAKRSRATAASCRRTRRRCCRSRASARTRPARSAASPSASAPPSSTPTSRACCSGCSSAQRRSSRPRDARHLWALSEALVPHKHVFDFNQALMDFGATVCVARKPKCLVCPMAKRCRVLSVQCAAGLEHDRRTRRGRGRSSATADSW